MAEENNPAAVALGKLGASKGEKARAEKLSKERKSEIAPVMLLGRVGLRCASKKNPDGIIRSVLKRQ
jgi:hypothetical protein